MKFYERHRKEILEAVAEEGMSKDEFSFIKRRGRIMTQHNESKNMFSYFQKEEIGVEEISGDWKDVTYFEIQISGHKVKRVDDWPVVIHQMRTWLKSL